jgi:hypothetical protein
MSLARWRTRTFAGITLIDTPLVHSALEYARKHIDEMSFNHVYRSWVFGALLASKLPEFKDIDLEVHAVSAILHDLAWDYRSAFSSRDKRFEVDGANAAREFLAQEAPKWDPQRNQLVWDSIALHTIMSIAPHKEPEVALCHFGISVDFLGANFSGGVVSEDEYNAVVKELPLNDFKEGVKTMMCGLCIHKPETTYDGFARDFGTRFVKDYKPVSVADKLMGYDALPTEG